MTTNTPHRTGDQLRNENSYDYLKQFYGDIKELNKREGLPQNLRQVLKDYLEIFGEQDQAKPYDENTPYGDAYTQFLAGMQKALPDYYHAMQSDFIALLAVANSNAGPNNQQENNEIRKSSNERIIERLGIAQKNMVLLNSMVRKFYDNDNESLERSAELIKDLVGKTTQTEHQIESAVTRFLSEAERPINQTTPQQEGSIPGRAKATISSTYQPMLTTSLPQHRKYQYIQDSDPREFRAGTQAERIEGKVRVNPLFELYVEQGQNEEALAIAEKLIKDPTKAQNIAEKKITHILYNNLGVDRNDFEGKKEKAFSLALHDGEKRHKNLAVISIPADKGIMAKSFLQHQTEYPFKRAKEILNAIASSDENRSYLNDVPDDRKDFRVSEKVRQLLEEVSGKSYKDLIQGLVDEAFEDLGYDKNSTLSSAQLQAVFFHFSKNTFTHYCNKHLKPKSFNMACKDAIDRGGVSSAYYNLMRSIEQDGESMSKEEFHKALHAAPTMVKGRGMNHHAKLIWNAIDQYLGKEANREKAPSWLSDWRFENAPKERAKDCLDQHLQQMINELKEMKNDAQDEEMVNKAIESLEETQKLINENPNPSSAYGLIYQTALQIKILVQKTEAFAKDHDNIEKKKGCRLAFERFSNSYQKSEKHYNSYAKCLTSFFKWIGKRFSQSIGKSYATDKQAKQIIEKQLEFKNKLHDKSPEEEESEINENSFQNGRR